MTSVNIGYAWGQLQRALAQGNAAHVAQWQRVIEGMQSGALAIGSRTPTAAPPWVTLEVAHGGFATGRYAAGGPLLDHERAALARLGGRSAEGRRALNLAALAGGELAAMLASGCYRVDVPEEGALLVAAWLFARGETARAEALIDELSPWFGELRFYPRPAERPLDETDAVRRQDVALTLDSLVNARVQPQIEAMHEALLVWAPLYARAVALASEEIGDGWRARVRALLDEYARLRRDHAKTGEPDHRKSHFRQLRELLDAATQRALDRREGGRLRRIVTAYVARHGVPFSAAWQTRREGELRSIAAPLHRDLRAIAIERLRALPGDGGIAAFDAIAAGVTAAEARGGVPEGSAFPPSVVEKLARSLEATPETLLARGVIGSAEVLAQVLPQITGNVRASAIADRELRRLDRAIYAAFRRRRSLLLLSYAHQVQLEELPWMRALDEARRSADMTGVARDTLARAAKLALTGFPATITPNKLVTELGALAKAAALKLPLVEEIASDIFMGGFTAKFQEAAHVAARLLAGTLYARYYAIDISRVLGLTELRGTQYARTAPQLAELCSERAGVGPSRYRSVVQNGLIIEQCQILTTHNLAVLFDAFPLATALDLRALAETTFVWVARQLRIRTTQHIQELRRLKNVAYAWRQMVFYLSFTKDVPAFLAWARQTAEKLRLGDRIAPALRGLELAARGIRSDAPAFAERGGRVLTGWTTEKHWLA